jgi:hypothetical protein
MACVTPSARRAALAALALAATAPLAACSGGPEIHPGDAAVVDGEAISLERVDALAEDLCALEEPSLAQQGVALPMAFLRSIAVEALVTDALLPAFAEQVGIDLVEVRRGVRDQVKTSTAQAPPEIRDEAEQRLELDFARRTVLGVAGQQGAANADQAVAQGAELFARWRADQQVEIDPRFDAVDLDNFAWEGDTGSLSIAADDAVTGVDVEAAATLPAEQRCGDPA